MSDFIKTVLISVLLCVAFCGRSAWADPITVDLPDLVGDFVHGDAPISATATFGDVSGLLSSLLIEVTATGTTGFSGVDGELPAEIVVSAMGGGRALISQTVLGPYGPAPVTLEAFNAWGTLGGDLDGTLTSDFEIAVTIATHDVYSAVTTAPVVHITSVTVTATFDPNDCGWMGCDGFVGIAELNVVLGNWNQNVTPGDFLSGDITGDGFVGIEDLNQVLGNWNAGTPPTAVPEPAALALLGLMLCATSRWGEH